MKNVWSTPTHAKMLKLVIMKKVIYENDIESNKHERAASRYKSKIFCNVAPSIELETGTRLCLP